MSRRPILIKVMLFELRSVGLIEPRSATGELPAAIPFSREHLLSVSPVECHSHSVPSFVVQIILEGLVGPLYIEETLGEPF
jgi:hypothetical protein